MRVGIIAGSGLIDIPGLDFVKENKVFSRYGTTSESYKHFTYNGTDIYFLRRHGAKHGIPPHMINYRANMDGFLRLGVDKVVAVSAVGGITAPFRPGDIVIAADAIDFTSGRNSTFFHRKEIFHVDMTSPFCPLLRKQILSAAEKAGVSVYDGGVYVCTNGPRYETAAEVTAYGRLGADFVGMTLFPECVLARELGICYANISVITNYAAGISKNKLTSDEVLDTMGKSAESVKLILHKFLEAPFTGDCRCKESLKGAKISDE